MKLVTVFGASGRMGQAQVRQLILAGYKVRAITRKKGVFIDEAIHNNLYDFNIEKDVIAFNLKLWK